MTDTTLGDFLYITDVQLEPGTVATPFERRNIAQELVLCERYYYKMDGFNCAGYNLSGAGNIQTVSIPKMRVTPSASLYGSATGSNASLGSGSGNPQGATTAVIYAVNASDGAFQVSAAAGNGYQYTAEL